MIDWLLEPWTYSFMRWALVSCVVLAAIHAYLGFHVVHRGVLFVDLAMAQMAALGSAAGIVLGFEHDTPQGYGMSLGFALGTAALIALLRSRRIHQEAIVAIIYGVATAATFVVLEHSPHGMDEVKHLFVGQVLTVDPRKIVVTTVIYAALGLVLVRLHPRILEVTENRGGDNRTATEIAFYTLFAVVVTSSVALAGVLLVFALLVLPAVAAIYLARRTSSQLAAGTMLGGAGGMVGLHAAFYFDMPAAPVIVLALAALLTVALLAGRSRR